MLAALLDRFTVLHPAGDVERTASFVIAGISRAGCLSVTPRRSPEPIVPTGSAYRGDAVQLDLPVLDAGQDATISAPDGIEAAVVLLAGDIDISGPGIDVTSARRVDVFDEPATAVYLPPGTAKSRCTPTRTPSSHSRRPSAASCTRRPAPRRR